ncbi:MAG: HlyD family efflux transporter periplasmic adaptor subunit [Gammaproteobacteria bacterium]|nr:HlyD family efflux transporter periplasmic adaptor subunit [Gammaproteobacteria bacterium]
MSKKLLPLVWLVAIVSLAFLVSLLKLESTHFFGIADDHEQTISFSYPVEIVQIFAVEGGEVSQGMQILEVRRRDLGTKLVIIEDQIQALKATSDEDLASTQARLDSLRAQQAAELSAIDSKIENLRSQQRLNEKLLKEISGSKTRVTSSSPIDTEIQGMLEQRGHIEKSLAAQISNLESQLSATVRPFDSKLAELEERRTEFLRQITDLRVVAKFNGRVGSVNVKPGETVAPFETILTVHGLSPKFVKGYIHENVFNQVAIGQQVWVKSNTNTNNNVPIAAVVESLGSRIVEYPMRLKKNMMVSAWGREAVIRLTEENNLLLGEKVIVTLDHPENEKGLLSSILGFISNGIGQTQAASLSSDPAGLEGYPIRSLVNGLEDHQIEASGIISALRDDSYLIVSDESENDKPELFKINSQGELVARLGIQTSEAVDDLESISREGDSVYVLSSLDKSKKKRRHLLRLSTDGNSVISDGQVNMYDVLEGLSKTAEDLDTRQFLKTALRNKSIELEAHNVYQNDLYLGFKTPLNSRDETVILKLENIQGLFLGEPVKGRIWRSVSLLNPETGSPALLSDMLFYNGRLLLLGVSKGQGSISSHLWSYQPETSALRSLKTFDRLRAEGISATSKDGEVVVVFDGDGKNASRFLPLTL